MAAIREVVESELTAFIHAHQALMVAQRLRKDAPEDHVCSERVDVAVRQKRDAGQLLRAALAAQGFTYAELQAEMKQIR